MHLVVVPLKKELKLILQSLEQLGHPTVAPWQKVIWFHPIPSLNATFIQGGMGEDSFAERIDLALHELSQITSIVGVGSAGALSQDLDLGDVVIGSKILKMATKDSKGEFVFQATYRLENYELFSSTFAFQILVGPIASLQQNVSSASVAQTLKAQSGALATCWEAAGGARAAQSRSLPYCEIRSITDRADENLERQFSENLPRAMENLAQVLAALPGDLSMTKTVDP